MDLNRCQLRCGLGWMWKTTSGDLLDTGLLALRLRAATSWSTQSSTDGFWKRGSFVVYPKHLWDFSAISSIEAVVSKTLEWSQILSCSDGRKLAQTIHSLRLKATERRVLMGLRSLIGHCKFWSYPKASATLLSLLLLPCFSLNVCVPPPLPPPSICVNILTLKAMIFGGGALGVIRSRGWSQHERD